MRSFFRRLIRPIARYHRYTTPAAGFVGWYDVPVLGAIAFDAGDCLVYSW